MPVPGASPDRPPTPLPPGFRFGVGSAAYAVEGAVAQDGRGPSIWDTFAAQPGRIADGSTGVIAADHYHRHGEDVELLERLGVGGYRLSLSWSRIQPDGAGAVNPAGLDFYDRLLDDLLAQGIAPMVTLYHWDLPQALEDDGGWLNRATIEHFAAYAALVGERFSDRVEHWIPVNEPNIATVLGYGSGRHAPGRTLLFDAMPVAHHLMLAHGRAAIALRDAGASSVGCANHHAPMWPASDDEADVGATKLFDALWNGMFLEPMLLGRYPVDLQPLVEPDLHEGDLATIRQPLDFYGVSYDGPMKIGATAEDSEYPFERCELLGYPLTESGRSVVPDALREWLVVLRARFRAALPPILITECGAAYSVSPDEHGVVDDQERIDFLQGHLQAVSAAAQRGVDVRGFYAGSLLDSFEWSAGLSRRSGLVHVDHDTQARTPKRSFEWYAALIAAQTRSVG
ncbi:unannotated protein [freshwater metagenome]|uniref:Unannotated protein n=1 Tax=freshwater metagenome TaxID=449393 RepID=A0A6J6PRM2_9ZZZZ